MAAKDRLMLIREQIKTDKKVVVADLSCMYNVTEETIRRDLEKLESEGILTRTFGGAVLNNTMPLENLHYYKRAAINSEEKRKIATAFYDVLKTKSTISTDSSTTVMEAVKMLNSRNSRNSDITILSVSTEIFRELAETDIRIISTGGNFNKKTLSLQGVIAKENISRYHVDIVLISCKGLDIEKGAMDTNENEAEMKRCMIKQGEEVALLADHTKFNKTVFAHLVDLEEIDYLVTDQEPDEEWIRLCKEKKIQLIY